jgi:hypothetical protein
MRAFQEESRREFEERLLKHLTAAFTLDADRLQVEVPPLIERAQEYGMRRERDVARYVEWLYRYSNGGPLNPLSKEAQNILLAYGVEPSVKLDRLEQWARENQPSGRQ